MTKATLHEVDLETLRVEGRTESLKVRPAPMGTEIPEGSDFEYHAFLSAEPIEKIQVFARTFGAIRTHAQNRFTFKFAYGTFSGFLCEPRENKETGIHELHIEGTTI